MLIGYARVSAQDQKLELQRSAPARRSRQPPGLCSDTLQVDSCLDTPLACFIVHFPNRTPSVAPRPHLGHCPRILQVPGLRFRYEEYVIYSDLRDC